MNWYDLKFDEKTEDEFNWKVRYDFLIKNVDDMNYILSRCHAKRVGNLYVSICPLPSHNEKTGSFTIFPPETIGRDGKPQGKTTFCCFGCGVAGDIITFYQHYNSAKDIFNVSDDEDYDKVKAEVIKLLRMKYSLEIMSEDPLDFKKIEY